MTIKISGRSREVPKMIRDRKPFQGYGSFRATTRWEGDGVLPRRLWPSSPTETRDIDYVVYSYATPIAWHHPENGWTVPAVKYSMTTSHHQGRLYLIEGEVNRPN